MIHAALIMAHKNVGQVARLAERLASPNMRVFLHFDSRLQMSNAELTAIHNLPFVHMLPVRRRGTLDTWSLVEITLALIAQARKTERELSIQFSYYLLLSGQDYLIKGYDELLMHLEREYPKPLIDCTPYSASNWVHHKYDSVGIDAAVNEWLNPRMRRGIVRSLLKLLPHALEVACRGPKTRLVRNGQWYRYDLYGGSAWWILPREVIRFIERELAENPRAIRRLKKVRTPEETFFQVMAMASPLRAMVDVNSESTVEQNCQTYAHFSAPGKPFRGHPYVLTCEDKALLDNRPELFARKFDETIDIEILQLLDAGPR